MFAGEQTDKPECLKRVEKLTGKSVNFINCDVTNKEDLTKVFQQVEIRLVFCLCLIQINESDTLSKAIKQ